MNKKRIFIEAHYLEIGGAEISLIGLLNSIDYTRYDVDLFLYSHRGELMQLIPPQVNLLPEIPEYAQMERPLWDVFKNGFWKQGFARIRAHFKYIKWKKKHKNIISDSLYEFVDIEIMHTLPSLYCLGTYDLAVNFICFKGHIPSKVHAKKTATWIHTDLCATNVSYELEFSRWNAFDYIVSISPAVTKSFLKLFPTLSFKIVEIENILSPYFVRNRAEEFNGELPGNGIKLLSIGRFCKAKNYDNVPYIAKRMVENGYKDFKWYIIGYGGDESLICQKIKDTKMDDHVILLGKKENPYPYIKECDVYVQPSRYEGKSVTVREAQILFKPVVITNYPTAKSQINHGVDGIIVPLENKGCAQGLIDFIQDKTLQHKVIENLKVIDFGNESEIEKFYDLINNKF